MPEKGLPRAFLERRGHSLMGLWLVLFIIFHLLTNSQASLFVGQDGAGFIHDVNFIHSLPYLPVLELLGLGVPILFHGWWGIRYALKGRPNAHKSDGTTPSLKEYPRNRAYSWQRITSWILLIGITFHVVQMRFLDYPSHVKVGDRDYYVNYLSFDTGLITLADRLGVTLYHSGDIGSLDIGIPQEQENFLLAEQRMKQKEKLISLLQLHALPEGKIAFVAKDFGTAALLMVRDTFKSPVMIVLYSLLVISACFHAFNGLWTFCISWGVVLTPAAQKMMLRACQGLMVVVTFLGLCAAWGTYWINLYE